MAKIDAYKDYGISSDGRVYSFKRGKKEMKQQMGNAGYYYVTLCKNGKRSNHFVHRLVATAFVKNPNNEIQVNHIDGDKTNNDFKNLEWVSPSENIKHAHSIGKAKISDLCKQKLRERSIVKVIDLQTGIVYDSIKEACLATNTEYQKEIDRRRRNSKLTRFINV